MLPTEWLRTDAAVRDALRRLGGRGQARPINAALDRPSPPTPSSRPAPAYLGIKRESTPGPETTPAGRWSAQDVAAILDPRERLQPLEGGRRDIEGGPG